MQQFLKLFKIVRMYTCTYMCTDILLANLHFEENPVIQIAPRVLKTLWIIQYSSQIHLHTCTCIHCTSFNAVHASPSFMNNSAQMSSSLFHVPKLQVQHKPRVQTGSHLPGKVPLSGTFPGNPIVWTLAGTSPGGPTKHVGSGEGRATLGS